MQYITWACFRNGGLLLIIVCSNDDPEFTFTDFKYGEVKFCNLGFSVGKNEKVDFSITIAACDLKLIELMYIYKY